MTIHIESYNPPPELVQMYLEFMNKLANDVRKQTEAPEGACAMAALIVIKGFIEATEEQLKAIALPDDEPGTKH